MTSLALLVLLLVGVVGAGAQPQPNSLYLLSVDGSINPITKDYVIRGIQAANTRGAALIVIELDTPGGLMESMKDIIQAMLDSAVPVVVYVAPAGARAASAGALITLAADVAAMAPGTHIGAAHPVGLGGTSPQDDRDKEGQDTMAQKLENDAAAFARSIAQQQGRNVEWAEKAVRESDAITATEALEVGVIDLMADDWDDLLKKLDGFTLVHKRKAVDGRTLSTAGLTVRPLNMTWRERLLNYLADPNIVYFLLLIGMYGLIYEFFSPGIGFGLAAGGLSLLFAFLGLQILPVNIVGLALILFGVLLMVLDVFTPTHGILTTGGVLALLGGSFTLFDLDSPAIQLSWWTVALTVGVITALFVFVISKGLIIQKRPPTTGPQGLIGAVGQAREDLIPEGLVFVKGEYWKAISPDGEPIQAGDEVTVEAVQGQKLLVRRRSLSPPFQSDRSSAKLT